GPLHEVGDAPSAGPREGAHESHDTEEKEDDEGDREHERGVEVSVVLGEEPGGGSRDERAEHGRGEDPDHAATVVVADPATSRRGVLTPSASYSRFSVLLWLSPDELASLWHSKTGRCPWGRTPASGAWAAATHDDDQRRRRDGAPPRAPVPPPHPGGRSVL